MAPTLHQSHSMPYLPGGCACVGWDGACVYVWRAAATDAERIQVTRQHHALHTVRWATAEATQDAIARPGSERFRCGQYMLLPLPPFTHTHTARSARPALPEAAPSPLLHQHLWRNVVGRAHRGKGKLATIFLQTACRKQGGSAGSAGSVRGQDHWHPSRGPAWHAHALSSVRHAH